MTPLLPLLLLQSGAVGRIQVDASRPVAEVSPRLYGVFLEEINNACEGGLYAELIQNRGFEDANLPPACTREGDQLATPKRPSFWEGYSKDWRMDWPYAGMGETPYWRLTHATMRVTTERPLSAASPHAVEIDARPGATLENEGFWGIGVRKGARYDLSFFTRDVSYQGDLEARLVSGDGTVLARTVVSYQKSRDWRKTKATLYAMAGDPKARFALVTRGSGKLALDFISLMPQEKWRGLPLRPDLANMIADLKPGFVRWPGGCVVEGITIETRPQWKQTIGPLHERVPTFIPWGYWVSNGFGYHEWLEFCERLGAEPLYVFSAGISCAFRSGTYIADDDLEPLIQDTLDAIEYAVGPVTSKYGAMRAKAGHPKPFPMRMVEIGNEAQGPKYGARVRRFMEAIRAKYPKMKVALSSWISGIDHPAINAAGPGLDIVDEHAYRGVNWSIQNFDSFARYPRDVPWELYIGEFATNAGVGRGNMRAALGDAAYMMSMEKNADLVKMGSYAPLLENLNRRQWEVNLIHFDATRAYGRAAYYACRMFAQNLPTHTLATKVEYTPPGEATISGPIGIGTYGTAAEFRDIRVNGQPLDAPWRKADGVWTKEGDTYRQTGRDHDLWSYFGGGYRDATITLRARKLEGDEGFVVSVGDADGRRVQFNVGGWGNTLHAIEAAGVVRRVPGKVEAGRWYDVRLETKGRNVKAYLDGALVFDETLPRIDTVLAVAGRDARTGEIVVKALNPGGMAAAVDLELAGAQFAGRGSATVLTSADPEAENTLDYPRRIVPVTRPLSSLRQILPPYSITVFRLKAK